LEDFSLQLPIFFDLEPAAGRCEPEKAGTARAGDEVQDPILAANLQLVERPKWTAEKQMAELLAHQGLLI
jgi:hypothetical protein